MSRGTERKIRDLRACVNCGLLKTFTEFLNEGCENCEHFLRFWNNPERITLCTCPHFEGLIGVPNRYLTWVPQLRHIGVPLWPGLYAIFVFASIPPHTIREILAPLE